MTDLEKALYRIALVKEVLEEMERSVDQGSPREAIEELDWISRLVYNSKQ